MNVSTQLAFFLFSLGFQPMGWCLPHPEFSLFSQSSLEMFRNALRDGISQRVLYPSLVDND